MASQSPPKKPSDSSHDESNLLRRARAEEEQLITRYRELGVELQAVDERLNKIRAFLELLNQYTRPPAGQPLAKDLANMTIADASAAVLRSLGGEARLTDIIKTLRRVGKLPESTRGAYSTLVQTLKRYPKRFDKTRAGVWRLVEEPQVPAPSGERSLHIFPSDVARVREWFQATEAARHQAEDVLKHQVVWHAGSGKSGGVYGFQVPDFGTPPSATEAADALRAAGDAVRPVADDLRPAADAVRSVADALRPALDALRASAVSEKAVNVSQDDVAQEDHGTDGSPDSSG